MSTPLPAILPTREKLPTPKTPVQPSVGRPTTSISRITQNSLPPSTSISHPGVAPTFEVPLDDEERDKLRYAYAQRKLFEKRAAKSDDSGFHAGHVGRALSIAGRFGLHHRLAHYIYTHKGEYKNLSANDRKILEDIIKNQLKPKPIGSNINFRDRRKMKGAAFRAWKASKIAKADYDDFKSFIDTL